MSQENVDVAERAIAAFNAREVADFAALTAPDFEWSPSMVAIEGEIFRGSAGIEKYFANLGDAWEEFQILRDAFVDHHAGVVVMLGRLRGRGKGSGVLVDSSLGIDFDLRAGKITRIRSYLDHGEALHAAGLSE